MPSKRPVRRAQLISTFGVGGMIDFPRDESYMIAGLEVWPYASERPPSEWLITEERLQSRLGVDHFRLPPEYRDPAPGVSRPNQRIPSVRFPRWHYCPHPQCGSLTYLSLYQSSWVRCPAYQGTACSRRGERQRPFVIPVRFIAVCRQGHIEDFPFVEWVHDGRDPGTEHVLRYRARGSSASLSGIVIECGCGRSRTMSGSFEYDEASGGPLSRIGCFCRGDRPWLGETDGPDRGCGEHLRTLQRGASNVYFPLTISSIYLPLWAEREDPRIIRTLEDPAIWDFLTSGLDEGRFIQRDRSAAVARMRDLDPDALHEAAQRRLDDVPENMDQVPEVEYRRSEYEAFLQARGGPDTDLLVEVRDGSEYDHTIRGLITRVCLVRKLRETRALAGFTRILPPSGTSDDRLQQLSNSELGWLPAAIVRGEGIFLEFSVQALQDWSRRADVTSRTERLAHSVNQKRAERGLEQRSISPKFLLLHTFAHILIDQLSFECGYGSASLRERIYCETDSEAEPMQGLLIYTASGDSEGTLGGLVRQGESGRLEPTVVEGLRKASWCSSDPVCIESSGQGADNANLAACHGCVLISETSCEEGNRLLDRAVVVGQLENPDAGFFSRLIREAIEFRA